MAVAIVFLGKLAELAGQPQIEVQGPLDWEGLLDELVPLLRAAALEDRTRIAVNGEVLADKGTLTAQDGDEIALLPPVSGG